MKVIKKAKRFFEFIKLKKFHVGNFPQNRRKKN